MSYWMLPENIDKNLTPSQLVSAAQFIESRFPNHVLVKNHAGNLAIVRTSDQVYVAYLDLLTGEVGE